ncbi:MAG: family 43 glycosylhydrolase [Hymenobacter sp.]
MVWTPSPPPAPTRTTSGPRSSHFFNGKRYPYYAGRRGQTNAYAPAVGARKTARPTRREGTWVDKGQAHRRQADRWAIDGSVFENKGPAVPVWSGWDAAANGRQDIYLARLKDPWTVEGARIAGVEADLPLGKVRRPPGPIPTTRPHIDVTEGPEVIHHGNDPVLHTSASACWTDTYALGALKASADADRC